MTTLSHVVARSAALAAGLTMLASGVAEAAHQGVVSKVQTSAAGAPLTMDVRFTALANATNNNVLFATSGLNTVVTANTEIAPGAGCVAISPTQVRCSNTNVTRVSALLGDGNDSAQNATARPAAFAGQVGNDLLTGGGAADVLQGGDGNDTLTGGGAGDRLLGDLGTDTASYSATAASINVTLDGLTNDGAAGEGDNVSTENVTGGSGSDSLTGSAGANVLAGGAGNDTIRGGAGADQLRGDTGTDTVTYSGGAANVRITLDGFSDDGAAGEADNVATTVENAIGGNGSDVIVGSSAANVLRGGPGNDTADGAGGNDTVLGEDDNDTLRGGLGTDALGGGNGNDSLAGDAGNDTLAGDAGTDTATYAGVNAALTLSIDGAANDGAVGEGDNVTPTTENLISGNGADTITGSAAANVISAGPGTDNVDSGAGNDTVNVRNGDEDRSECGTGTDVLNADLLPFDTYTGVLISLFPPLTSCETVNRA
ncbi:MAG: calcium-binding protein [Baekduiaceae bacterium]